MTHAERMKAFCLRCRGKTWKQISAELHYSPQTIRDDLYAALARQASNQPKKRYRK